MLSLNNICVSYSYKNVLNGISLSFETGKVYSILGENGAGKSTLAHIICGDLSPTAGKISIENVEVTFKSPSDAIKKGIVCVHQKPMLCEQISVLDNLKLGVQIKKHKSITEANPIISQWLGQIELKAKVKTFSETQKFYISLTNALLKNPSVLILDEPPELTTDEIHKLTESGITIIMITHNLKEALSKSDEVILLQSGNVLRHCKSSDITENEIKNLLFGISKEVTTPDFIELQDIDEKKVEHQIGKTGIIPEDIFYKASNPDLTIFQLMNAYNTKGKQIELEENASELLKKADVNIKLHEKVSNLSGGMLQRLILERELSVKPEKLYLFNPTHGLDVEASEKLFNRLEKLHNEGTAIILGENK